MTQVTFIKQIRDEHLITPAMDELLCRQDSKGIMAESLCYYPPFVVLELVGKQTGKAWKMASGDFVVDGKHVKLDNPRLNNRGLWVYLMEKG
jgi:hypothetical protein